MILEKWRIQAPGANFNLCKLEDWRFSSRPIRYFAFARTTWGSNCCNFSIREPPECTWGIVHTFFLPAPNSHHPHHPLVTLDFVHWEQLDNTKLTILPLSYHHRIMFVMGEQRSSGDREELSVLQKRKRASLACVACRERKVRCDAMANYPSSCTNCALDQAPCTMAPRG